MSECPANWVRCLACRWFAIRCVQFIAQHPPRRGHDRLRRKLWHRFRKTLHKEAI